MDELTAWHESGHAFMAICLGATVHSVTIDPDRDDGPERFGDAQIEWPPEPRTTRKRLESLIRVALAGPVAEMLYSGDPFHPGMVPEWAMDWQHAWQVAAALFPEDRQRLSYLEQTAIQLHQLLGREDHHAALAAVADNLLAHETLEGEEIEDIMSAWLGRS